VNLVTGQRQVVLVPREAAFVATFFDRAAEPPSRSTSTSPDRPGAHGWISRLDPTMMQA
jgi:hypothetical protein